MEQGSTGLGEGGGRARKGPSSPIYSVELEVFEGPLDLLLHLVRKHELDILDIPIAFVAEKYLEYLEVMRQLDLEIAGDYLVMAATLAYLKSRELLPPEPRAGEAGESEEEAGEDPREALIRRLVEYERFKQAAAELDSLPVSGRDVFARGAELVMPPVDPGLAPVSLFNLAEAYYRVLTRAKVKSTHEVTIEPITVAQRIKQLALMLDEKPHFEFEELFLGRTWNSERELRQMLVVTLMSILEMVKLGVAGVQQPHESPTIRIYRRASAEQTKQALADYDEDASFGAPQAKPPEAEQPEAAPPAPEPRVSEAELDAVEEAALLAEALAAVQEPEEPVLGYADETEDVAANDPSGEYEEDEPQEGRGGRGRARTAEQARRGEPVREDMWDGGREPRDGEVSSDAAPVRGEGREEDGGAGWPGGGRTLVDVLSGRSSEDGADEAPEPHGLDGRDAAVLAAQGEGVREDRSPGEAPVAGEAGATAAAQGEDVPEDSSAGEGEASATPAAQGEDVPEDSSAGEGEASAWGAAPGEDVREGGPAGEASEATGEAGLDGRDDAEVVWPVEAVGEDARSEVYALHVVDDEVARVDEDLEASSLEHDESVETVAGDESEAAADAAHEQGAASSAADAGSTPGAGSATDELPILDEGVARERGAAEALREDSSEDRSTGGSEETGDGGESVGPVDEAHELDESQNVEVVGEGSGAAARACTLDEHVERAGEVAEEEYGLLDRSVHAGEETGDGGEGVGKVGEARGLEGAEDVEVVGEGSGAAAHAGTLDERVERAGEVAVGEDVLEDRSAREGEETCDGDAGRIAAPQEAEAGPVADGVPESGEDVREGTRARSGAEGAYPTEAAREDDVAAVLGGDVPEDTWHAPAEAIGARDSVDDAEPRLGPEGVREGGEAVTLEGQDPEDSRSAWGAYELHARPASVAGASDEAAPEDQTPGALEVTSAGIVEAHGQEEESEHEGEEARRGEDVPASTEPATTNECEGEEARASERSEVTARPEHDDVHEGDGPVRSDSDEEVAGGLFLNTGEGLGTRELVEVDDEDDAQ